MLSFTVIRQSPQHSTETGKNHQWPLLVIIAGANKHAISCVGVLFAIDGIIQHTLVFVPISCLSFYGTPLGRFTTTLLLLLSAQHFFSSPWQLPPPPWIKRAHDPGGPLRVPNLCPRWWVPKWVTCPKPGQSEFFTRILSTKLVENTLNQSVLLCNTLKISAIHFFLKSVGLWARCSKV